MPVYERLTRDWAIANPEDVEQQRNLGWAWIRLGNLYHSLGQYRSAISAHEQAQSRFNEIDFALGKAASLGNLGLAYYSLGQYQRAIDFHQHSLEIKREIGDRRGEAISLFNLSNIYQMRGQFKRSRSYRLQAYRIWQELNLPLEALPLSEFQIYEFQKRLFRAKDEDSLEQRIEDEQKSAWLLDTLGLIVFLVRSLLSPIRWIQKRLRPQK